MSREPRVQASASSSVLRGNQGSKSTKASRIPTNRRVHIKMTKQANLRIRPTDNCRLCPFAICQLLSVLLNELLQHVEVCPTWTGHVLYVQGLHLFVLHLGHSSLGGGTRQRGLRTFTGSCSSGKQSMPRNKHSSGNSSSWKIDFLQNWQYLLRFKIDISPVVCNRNRLQSCVSCIQETDRKRQTDKPKKTEQRSGAQGKALLFTTLGKSLRCSHDTQVRS